METTPYWHWTFEIWTDHRNLTYFQKPQNINRRQAGWVQKMQEYDLLYITWKGRRMSELMHYPEDKEKRKRKRTIKMWLFYQQNCSGE